MSSRDMGPYFSYPQDFSNLSQICSSNIQKIAHNTGQVKSMLFQLGRRPELHNKLQQMQHYTNQLVKETNKHLKDLGSLPLPQSPSEKQQKRLQTDRLMNHFSEALNNFQMVQRKAAEIERECMAKAQAGSHLLVEKSNQDEQCMSFEKNEATKLFQSQTEEELITEEDLELIQEREAKIRQIETDIMDVNHIFKELAVMIHEQGDIIDCIEANVERTEEHVDHGNEQLQHATNSQRKSHKTTCVLALALSILVIIIIIIFWQVNGK